MIYSAVNAVTSSLHNDDLCIKWLVLPYIAAVTRAFSTFVAVMHHRAIYDTQADMAYKFKIGDIKIYASDVRDASIRHTFDGLLLYEQRTGII